MDHSAYGRVGHVKFDESDLEVEHLEYGLQSGIPMLRKIFESITETLLAFLHLSNPIGPLINAHNMEIHIEN